MAEFGAPGVSALTVCNVPKLLHITGVLLSLTAFDGSLNSKAPKTERQLILNLVRRLYIAYEEYERARVAVEEYIEGARRNTLRYFEAVSCFETFISQLYQAHKFKEALLKKGGLFKTKSLFVPGDGSLLDRIDRIYNSCKHLEGQIVKGRLDDRNALPLTITLTGLKSNANSAEVSFDHLGRCLSELEDWARKAMFAFYKSQSGN